MIKLTMTCGALAMHCRNLFERGETMSNSPISKAINRWKWHWRQERKKAGVPAEEADWKRHLDQMPMSVVLWNLEIHEDD